MQELSFQYADHLKKISFFFFKVVKQAIYLLNKSVSFKENC